MLVDFPSKPFEVSWMAFEISVDVRFRDVDALSHVNNAVYLSYCEMARVAYFRDLGQVRHAADFSFILARAELDFLAPLGLEEEQVVVRLAVGRIGNSSWDFVYEVRRASGRGAAQGALPGADVVFARVKTVQVYYDYTVGEKRPIPQELRKRLQQDWDGEPR